MAYVLGIDASTTATKAVLIDESGAVATEYGLLLVLIALAIIAAATALGLAIAGVFDRGSTALAPVAQNACDALAYLSLEGPVHRDAELVL